LRHILICYIKYYFDFRRHSISASLHKILAAAVSRKLAQDFDRYRLSISASLHTISDRRKLSVPPLAFGRHHKVFN
jgi:hypothetical protein